MKKFTSAILLLSAISGAAVAADTASRENPSSRNYPTARVPDYAAADPAFVAIDIMALRPLGLVTTVIGSAFFIASSPLTALASIPEPHDAFESSYKILILAPARYTFERPVGDRTMMDGYDTQFGRQPPGSQSRQY